MTSIERSSRRVPLHSIASTLALALIAVPASAQDDPETGDAPAPEAAMANAPGGPQVFTPADFVRFAPRNALDMLNQLPGFEIRNSEQQRGFGSASGNVLFNGERPSSKSDDIFTQLQRIPASTVQRIEIVDGSTLDIPGLSGRVANVVFESGELTGQFSWSPTFRPYNTDPLWFAGAISASGREGAISYEVGLDNSNYGGGGADGITLIRDGSGQIIETRDDSFKSKYYSPKLSGTITWDAPGNSIGHFNAHYQRIYNPYREVGFRQSLGLPDQLRRVRQDANSWNVEVGGDYEFDLGPGRLKAIALRRFRNEPFSQTIVSEFADASPDIGSRFTQLGKLGETIGRGEYKWKMFGGDWQLAAEGAFNTLDNVSGLFVLAPSGDFEPVPFPGGTGGVSEDRYEGSLSFGRPLTDRLSFQLLTAVEHSTIATTGINPLERTFLRPKGQLSFAWKAGDNTDISFKIQRRVLQLSFYDFLARAFLNDNNQNVSNSELRPQQDWSYEAEINRKLGPWGTTQLRLIYRDVEDKTDLVPVAGGGEAVGNIPSSWAAAVVWTNTLVLDEAGLKGVKFETTIVRQTSRLRDPFTGENREWSGFPAKQFNFALRHDVPGSDWAYGGNANHFYSLPVYRSNSIDQQNEGPVFASVFVENKDVLGLTVRGQISNILGARSYRDRIVYQGLRDASPIAFTEERDRRIGPIFTFSVRGNF